MFCDNCGTELADNAVFCPNCGKKVKRVKSNNKNIYIALVLSFILTGLGSIYAGNTKKGLILLALRILFAALGVFSSVFFILSVLIWVYGFYEAYRDVQIANGRVNPKFLDDFKKFTPNQKTIAVLIIVIILIFTFVGCYASLVPYDYSSVDSGTHYYQSGSGSSNSGSSYSSGGSSSSSHYGGVDTSPHTIAKSDPDWYYDYYDYGDYDDIDNELESQGYD